MLTAPLLWRVKDECPGDVFDVPALPYVKGRVARSWRVIGHGRRFRRAVQTAARRRMRRAVRQAIQKGNCRDIPKPLGTYDVAGDRPHRRRALDRLERLLEGWGFETTERVVRP